MVKVGKQHMRYQQVQNKFYPIPENIKKRGGEHIFNSVPINLADKNGLLPIPAVDNLSGPWTAWMHALLCMKCNNIMRNVESDHHLYPNSTELDAPFSEYSRH